MNAPPEWKALFGVIAAHARSTYPAECCGLVLADGDDARRFEAIANIAGQSDTSTRTARDGYVMEPKALLAALQRADEQGGRLVAIVHSHPDVGAYFSREDRLMALGGGAEPLWPGVQYLVVSVRKGVVDDARLYTWEAAGADFIEAQISETAGI
jgi:proteasome lid subunit RPN8/RPN11